MAFVAERLGVGIVERPGDGAEVSLSATLTPAARRGHPERAAAHPAHPHGEGGRDPRASPRSSPGTRDLRSCSTRSGHVLKGYFGPSRTAFFKQVERALAEALGRPRRRQPRGARRARRAGGVAPREKFAVIRLGIPLEERLGDATADLDYRTLYGIPRDAFMVGWVGRMTGVKDTGAALEIPQGDARPRRRRGALPRRRRSRSRPARAGRARPSGSRAPATSSATRRTSPATTASSTRSCSVRDGGHSGERDRGARLRD